VGTTLEPIPDFEGEVMECCHWSTFFYFWKREFLKLKVRKPSADICICTKCTVFYNRHKYRKSTATNDSLTAPGDSEDEQGTECEGNEVPTAAAAAIDEDNLVRGFDIL
jgi:hypothetical protein